MSDIYNNPAPSIIIINFKSKMRALLSYLIAASCLAAVAHAHFVRDHWMHKNEINPDYMHRLAMQAQSHAARIDA